MKLVSIPGNRSPDGAVTGKVRTPDGVELRFARWGSPADSRGTVCVFSGRGEFIEKYLETAGDLRKRGFAVAMMDWRGQGHSSRQLADPRKGHVESFSEFEIDVGSFMQQVVHPNCPPPYFALAHSMGGAALLRIAHSGKRWFERTVLAAPMIDFPRARASLIETISRPNGSSETGISLKLASPSGRPMIVKHRSTPVIRCPTASHQPQSMNQSMFPIAEPAPASGRRTAVFPNGQRAKTAMRSAAIPNGIVMLRTKQINAAIA